MTDKNGQEPFWTDGANLNKIYNQDCMDGMKEIPDKFFDLAIVDPPYFSGPERRGFYGRHVSPIGVQRHYEKSENWSVPTTEYFNELIRVSKEQIVWGCNYFNYPFGAGRIVWDKVNGGSSIIARIDMELEYLGFEIDPHYHNLAEERIKEFNAQMKMTI